MTDYIVTFGLGTNSQCSYPIQAANPEQAVMAFIQKQATGQELREAGGITPLTEQALPFIKVYALMDNEDGGTLTYRAEDLDIPDL